MAAQFSDDDLAGLIWVIAVITPEPARATARPWPLTSAGVSVVERAERLRRLHSDAG